MLELKQIRKQYGEGESVVNALNGVSLKFRESEFVSILGASGCGKTTLLNIVGGLDRYTSGDLIINGKSTKDFDDGDWDTYRNHSIGFVFQSYNLIPHQTVLSNVELALTLSGVSKAERRQRATEALRKVGLGDQLHKRPNQMSGGQMQRVAIARALVNNPDILLADEPTGALDTATSVQIMDLLKEVAREKLVIMVTHNPELAAEYSTRIVKLSDGEVIDDTDPYECEEVAVPAESAQLTKKEKKAKKEKNKKKSMSFATAISLSFNNLLTKKARTILTSFAGSIGIIGIALILALSNGIQAYIDQVQEDTLSTYPLTVERETQDFAAMFSAMTEVSDIDPESIDPNKIYVDDSLGTMMSAMSATVSNDMVAFKQYLLDNYDQLEDAVSDIQYTYDFDLQIFTGDGKTQVSPTEIFDHMGDSFAGISEMMKTVGGFNVMSEMINNQALLDQQYELVGEGSHWPTSANEVVLVVNKNNQISKMTLYMLGVKDQSELKSIMEKLMKNGEYDADNMEEYSLDYFLGMKFYMLNTSDFFVKDGGTGDNGLPTWNDLRDDIGFDEERASFVTENGTELVISGIVRPKEGATATSISGAVGYTKALTDMILEMNAESEIIKQQKENPEYSVLTGLKFEETVYDKTNIGELIKLIDDATLESYYAVFGKEITKMVENDPPIKDAQSFMGLFMFMDNTQQSQMIGQMIDSISGTPMGSVALTSVYQMISGDTLVVDEKEDLLFVWPLLDNTQKGTVLGALMGMCNDETMQGMYSAMNQALANIKLDKTTFTMMLAMIPDDKFATIERGLYSLVPNIDDTYESTLKLLGDAESADPLTINFYAKDFESKETIENFIADYNKEVDEDQQIKYTDLIGIMMSSISTIINVISYVLIAFVSISLVVSSIMIGIITYISVLERTKEIGVLRSIGASKKDISRVFNAETLIVGLTAGLIGILFTVLLCLPINAIIHVLSGMYNINAVLPVAGGIALVLISMLLTFVAGLIPSRIAAKKDPVEALRSE